MTLLDAKSAEISCSLYLTMASRVKFTRPRTDLPPRTNPCFLNYFHDRDAKKERKTSD